MKIRVHRGRPELLKELRTHLRACAAARKRGEDRRVVVLLDQDDDECGALKARLERVVEEEGLTTRRTDAVTYSVVIRIAVRELENWYFGDWEAVRGAFDGVGSIPRKYANNPDRVAGKPSAELGRVLDKAGVTKESKRIWAQRIGPRLEPDRNASPSFRAFLTGVRDLVDRP